MRKITSVFVVLSFILSCIMPPQGFAQSLTAVGLMPHPGTQVMLSPVFTPAYLKGMVINPIDPFKFDFIINKGDELLTVEQKQEEYKKLIKYFLAALAVPDTEQWVNLSPYEKDRIIPDGFGLTEMGRDLLAQDYLLKQISASLTNPDSDLGKKFWDGVYTKAYEMFGTTDIPTDTFNKVWIIPDKAVVFEKNNSVVVLEHHLKVMMESDYKAMKENAIETVVDQDNETVRISKQVMREIIIPAIEKEVNDGKNFAPLRQVYSGMLLATWYKVVLKESILGKLYADQGKVKGVDQDPKNNQQIYDQYVLAFKKGVFNMIKEDADRYSQEVIPRRYFSGGMVNNHLVPLSLPGARRSDTDAAQQAVNAMEAADLVRIEVVHAGTHVEFVPFIPGDWNALNGRIADHRSNIGMDRLISQLQSRPAPELEEGDLLAVRRSDNFPFLGYVQPQSEGLGKNGRGTLHWTLSSIVREHGENVWSGLKTTIVVPFEDIPNQQLEGVAPGDTWIGGQYKLPSGAVIFYHPAIDVTPEQAAADLGELKRNAGAAQVVDLHANYERLRQNIPGLDGSILQDWIDLQISELAGVRGRFFLANSKNNWNLSEDESRKFNQVFKEGDYNLDKVFAVFSFRYGGGISRDQLEVLGLQWDLFLQSLDEVDIDGTEVYSRAVNFRNSWISGGSAGLKRIMERLERSLKEKGVSQETILKVLALMNSRLLFKNNEAHYDTWRRKIDEIFALNISRWIALDQTAPGKPRIIMNQEAGDEYMFILDDVFRHLRSVPAKIGHLRPSSKFLKVLVMGVMKDYVELVGLDEAKKNGAVTALIDGKNGISSDLRALIFDFVADPQGNLDAGKVSSLEQELFEQGALFSEFSDLHIPVGRESLSTIQRVLNIPDNTLLSSGDILTWAKLAQERGERVEDNFTFRLSQGMTSPTTWEEVLVVLARDNIKLSVQEERVNVSETGAVASVGQVTGTPELSKENDLTPGGIDLARSHLSLQIRRDGNGILLPIIQQDLDRIRIDGLVPVILNIQPAEHALVL